jgi:hypothetical protein
MRPALKAAALLVCVAVTVGVVIFPWIGAHGISAKESPGRIETTGARTMRRLAMPHRARKTTDPVARTPDVIAEGMAQYADHCATCHANDGSGDTEMDVACTRSHRTCGSLPRLASAWS